MYERVFSMHVCGIVKVCGEYEFVYVYVGDYVCMCGCMLQRFESDRAIRTSNKRPGPDPDSCSLWIRYTSDSKTDKQDDSEIRIGSCSVYPMVI